MRVLFVVTLVLLAGCDLGAKRAAEERHLQMEEHTRKLELRVAMLEAQNDELRTRIDALSPATTPASTPEGAFTTRCTGSGSSFRLNVGSFGDPSKLATEARIVPHFQNGVSNGFKLFSIRPGSFFASCGLMNGDIVKAVNGMDINSPDRALDAYAKLKLASRFDVEIIRQGTPQVLTIDIER